MKNRANPYPLLFLNVWSVCRKIMVPVFNRNVTFDLISRVLCGFNRQSFVPLFFTPFYWLMVGTNVFTLIASSSELQCYFILLRFVVVSCSKWTRSNSRVFRYMRAIHYWHDYTLICTMDDWTEQRFFVYTSFHTLLVGEKELNKLWAI